MKTSRVLLITLGLILTSKLSQADILKCPEGWELFNHVKCITILRNATNAFQADDACAKAGGQRWVYHTEIEDEFVLDLWKLNFPEKRWIFLWIGITLDEDQNYRWADGTLANDVADVNSACPKKDVCPLKILRRDMKESLVCSFECTREEVYPVCEKWLIQPTTLATSAEPSSEDENELEEEETTTFVMATTSEHPRVEMPQSPLCEQGWDYFNDHCYHLTPNKHKGGADARGACSLRGGDVVSVTSLEQQKFFETIIFYKDHGLAGDHYEGPAFLGARKNGNSSFIWESGQQLNFTYWAPNEPSSGNCIIISRLTAFKGKWRTVPCTLSQRVLCGKPTILGATTTAPTTTTTEQPIVRHSDVITVEYEDFDSEEMILRSKSMESNAEPEQPKSPVQNASLMISISVIILLAILFLICFVLRVRRKAKERNREKLHLEQTNGDSKTYVSKEP